MTILDAWRERRRTRDRLLEYDTSIIPLHPITTGLAMVYPWEDLSLSSLARQFFTIVRANGYSGTEEDFWARFSQDSIVYGTVNTFPIPGNENTLYLDRETEILYYFKETEKPIDIEHAQNADAIIVGENYLYIPVRALLIEDTIINDGTLTEGA